MHTVGCATIGPFGILDGNGSFHGLGVMFFSPFCSKKQNKTKLLATFKKLSVLGSSVPFDLVMTMGILLLLLAVFFFIYTGNLENKIQICFNYLTYILMTEVLRSSNMEMSFS